MQTYKKYIAEFIGTFFLALIVGFASKSGLSITPILAGVVLMLTVYGIGSISGAHINPGVTLGLLSVRKISVRDAAWYIVAQIVGALAAVAVMKGMYPEMAVTLMGTANNVKMLIAETIGMIFFAWGIAAIVFGKHSDGTSGVMIGGSLTIGIFIALFLGSGGGLNPAVVLAVDSFNWAYIIGPVLGSVIGMNLYKYLAHK